MTEPVPFSSVQHSEEPDSTVTSHPEGRNQQNGCTLATYAEAKRLPTALLTYLGVSDTLYYGKPALQMPYCDGDGVEQAVRLRIGLEKCEGSDDRFRWRLGGKIGLYGLPQLRPGKDVTLVEGESDTHTLIHHGVNVVGVPGAGSWNEVRDAVHLQSFDTIYAVIEPDAGGAALLKSLRESVLRDRVRIIRLTGFEDVSDMHVDNPERFQERWNEAVNASVPLDMLMSEDAEDHELAFYPFEMTRDGLFVEVPRGKTIQRRFLSAPFEVCGRCRDPNGNDWGRLLRFKDDDGDEHEHVVTDAALHGDRGVLCSDLAAQGLRLATVASDRSQFVRYLNEVRTHTRVTRLQRTGWHVVKGQPVFVHPTGALGAPTGEIVRFEGGPQSPYAHAGTLEEWQSSVGALIGRHSRLVLLCSAAFAGPLLYLIGHEGGGIHVHGESTTGKTTAVRAAASVWGKGGTPGYVLP
jgi:Domain of unknown function (DUF927)